MSEEDVSYSAKAKSEIVKHEIAALRSRSFRALVILLRTVRKMDGKPPFIRLAPRERYRLMILVAWAEKYKVPLPFVYQTLVSYWRQKTKRPGKRIALLGARLRSLTSKTSESILLSAIEREFPGAENIFEWKERKKKQLLGLTEQRGRPMQLLNLLSPDEILYNYDRRVRRRAKRMERASGSDKRKKRAWRGNPWI